MPVEQEAMKLTLLENDTTDLDQYAWYESNSNDKYQPVGTKKPNQWDLYDMHGNVAEWTLDQYLPTAYRTRRGEIKNPYQKPTKSLSKGGKRGFLDGFTQSITLCCSTPLIKKNGKCVTPKYQKVNGGTLMLLLWV